MTACRELHATWSFPVEGVTFAGLIDRDILLALRREQINQPVKEDSARVEPAQRRWCGRQELNLQPSKLTNHSIIKMYAGRLCTEHSWPSSACYCFQS